MTVVLEIRLSPSMLGSLLVSQSREAPHFSTGLAWPVRLVIIC